VKEDLGGINGKYNDRGENTQELSQRGFIVRISMLVCVSDYLTSTYKNDGGIS
jgi:hypothetical protein